MADGGARQQLERRVVVHAAVIAQHAAVPVRGVLAQAYVREHQQLRHSLLDRARRQLHRALLVPCAGALLVLLRRHAEQHHARNAECGGLTRLLHGCIDRQALHARHRRDRFAAARLGGGGVAHEQRQDQLPGAKLGLANEVAQARRRPQPAHARLWKGHLFSG
jgi:hypothetical protein